MIQIKEKLFPNEQVIKSGSNWKITKSPVGATRAVYTLYMDGRWVCSYGAKRSIDRYCKQNDINLA